MSSVHFETTLDAQKLYQTLEQIEQRMGQMADASVQEANRIDSTYRKVAGLMASYFTFAAGKQFITELVAVRGEFQQLGISLETILKDKEKADKLMANVVEFAAYTPFELTEVGHGVKKLLAFNVQAEDSIDILRRLGDISSGLSTDLDGMVQAYGKVKAKGKLQAEEMNLFLERGVPLVKMLEEKYNATGEAIYKMAEKGQIKFQDLHEVIVSLTDEGGMFANMMEKQAETLPGQISNLKDAIAQMLDEIGQSNEGVLYGGIGVAKTLVENYDKVLIALKALIAGYGAYKTATITMGIIEQVQAVGSLAKALKASTLAQKALNLAQKASPIGLALGVVSALVVAMVALAKRTREAKEDVDQFKEVYAGIDTGVQLNYADQFLELENLKKKLTEVKGSREDELKIIDLVNDKYGDHITSLLGEKSAYEDLKKAIDEATSSLEKHMEIDILMDQARAIKQAQMGNESLWAKFIEPNLKEGYSREELKKLGKEAENILQEEFNIKFKGDIVTAFGQLKNKLIDDSEDYTTEMERLMEKVRKIEEGLLSVDDDDKFDITVFTKSIKQAKKAYKEWAQFKETSQADELKGDYDKYLSLGVTYKEFLETKLKEYKGNHAAVIAITKELAGIEVGEIKATKEAAEELQEQMDDLWEEVLKDMDNALEKQIEKMGKAQTANLKKYEKDMQDGLNGIAKIASRYASSDEILQAQLQELDNYYKLARLPLDKKYYELRDKIIKEALAAELDEFAYYAQAIFSEMGSLFGQFNDEAASSMNALGNLAGSTATAAANFVSGNVVGGITSSISALGSLFELFRDDSPQFHNKQISNSEEAYNRLNDVIAVTNRLLGEQYEILDDTVGTDWFRAIENTIKMVEESIADVMVQMTLALNQGRSMFSDDWVWTIGWSTDDFQSWVDNNMDDPNSELVQGWLDQYKEYEEALQSLGVSVEQKVTGTTADAITETLTNAFASGEIAAEDFTKTFEDLMKQAIIESFKVQFLEKQMAGWYDLFAEFADGGLSPEELSELRSSWDEKMLEAKEGWEALSGSFDFLGQDIFGDSDPNSLAGAISRQLTEETGSLLAGYMNSMRLDVREGADLQGQMVASMGNIEFNTYKTADHLKIIRKDIRLIRTQLIA